MRGSQPLRFLLSLTLALIGLLPTVTSAALSPRALSRFAAAARPAALAASLAASPGEASSAPIAADADGSSYLLWQDTRSPSAMGLFVQKFNAAGQPQWTEGGVPVSMAYGYEHQWQGLPDGLGGVYIVWEDDRTYDSSDQNLYLQHVLPGGTIAGPENGVAVCEQPYTQSDPVLAADGFGGVFVTWTDRRIWGHTDIYAQRFGAACTPLWTVDGVLVCGSSGDQFGSEVTSDANGFAIVTWSDARLGELDMDVYAQRMDTSGVAQWTANGVRVSDRSGDQASPVIASDEAGGAIIAWTDLTPDPEYEASIYAQRLGPDGNARWGSGGYPICAAPSTQYWSRIVEDGAGGVIIAWQDFRNDDVEDIYAQRVDSTGAPQWQPDGVAVCVDTLEQTWTTIASDGARGAIVAWRDALPGYGAEIKAQRVDSLGTTPWADNGVSVCAVSSSKALLSIASSGSGSAVIAWVDTRSRLEIDLYAQRLDSGGEPEWTPGGELVLATTRQTSPLVVATGSGSTVSAWMEKRLGQYDIRARKQDSAGNALWSARGVCEAPDLQNAPVAVDDGAGGAIFAWMDYRAGGNEIDVYAQRMTSDGAAAWAAGGVAVCTVSGGQWFPMIATDGAGGAILTWQDERSGTSDIYAQRLDASGVPQWAANGVAVCDAAESQQYPSIVPDGAGGVIVAWQDSPGEGGGTISAQRMNGAGERQWATDGVLLVTGFAAASRPMITTDGAGGAIASWEDSRSGAAALYVQRVRSGGEVAWAASGVRLANATGAQQYQVIVPTPTGGAIVVWDDLRDVFDYDVYAQRVDSLGVVQWNAAGVVVCNMGDHQFLPVAMPDGLGGVITAWSDARAGTHLDVYVQRLNSLGQRRWGSEDMPVSIGADDQQLPAIASDGAGGVVVAWEDERDHGLPMLYAQRHDLNGVPQWTGGGVVPAWISLSRSEATPESARLEWYAADAAQLVATVYRREEGGDWQALGTLNGDGSGLFVYDDRAITPGRSYAYRLGVVQNGLERFTSESWVEVPLRARFAFAGSWPNPSVGELRVAFSLRGGAPARLELLDIAGRHVRAWDLSGAGAGSHVRTLADARGVAPGVYVLRLTEGAVQSNRRVTIMR
ncbi:MAG: hypothetical protein IT348_19910, partial [Candidatus Eisenbacteria bacterium]|nr:hypothetical protein [Candidatus Eisenbacteria bacterium]